jgi:sugar O-acyltransferase (sialic acid O-acetyltransferase NeuD family)
MNVILLGAANPETIRVIRAVERTQPNFHVVGFLDNDPTKWGASFFGFPVFGGFECLGEVKSRFTDLCFVNLITGSTKARLETSRRLAQEGCAFTNLIHPTVDLTMTSIGIGNYLQEGVIVQAGVRIGDNSSIHIGTLVGHESVIGNSTFIAHGCSISGCVEVGDGVFMGTHATVIPRLKIGKWATIGAGAVVVRDVPEHAVVVGNPARVVRYSEPDLEDGSLFREAGR